MQMFSNKIHEFVSILTWSWNSDGSRPVEVHMGQFVGKLLDNIGSKRSTLFLCHHHMSWSHSSLQKKVNIQGCWNLPTSGGEGAKVGNFNQKLLFLSNFGEISAKVGGSCPIYSPGSNIWISPNLWYFPYGTRSYWFRERLKPSQNRDIIT